MNGLKRILILLTGGLMVLNTFAAPDRPLHVLYLGSVDGGGGGFGGFGGPRTNYVYLPGQTLAPEAIYFDHLSDLTHLPEKYLSHFDAVVQVMPDAEVGAAQLKMLDSFKNAERTSEVLIIGSRAWTLCHVLAGNKTSRRWMTPFER